MRSSSGGLADRDRMRYGSGMTATPARSEAQLEKLLHDGVRRLGGISVKMAPTMAGVPDRMVLWPGGRIDLVELKTDRGSVRRIQEVQHHRFAKLGTYVQLVRGESGVRRYLAAASQQINQPQAAVSA